MPSAPPSSSSLTIFGGMAAEFSAANLPAGPAVIAEDVDFTDPGSVRTRDGLSSVYSYLNLFDSAHAATGTQSGSGQAWNTPSNVTTNNPSTPATVSFGSSIDVYSQVIGLGTPSVGITINNTITPNVNDFVLFNLTTLGGIATGPNLVQPSGFTNLNSPNQGSLNCYNASAAAGTPIVANYTVPYNYASAPAGISTLIAFPTNGNLPVLTLIASFPTSYDTTANTIAVTGGTSLIAIVYGYLYSPYGGEPITAFSDTNGNTYTLVTGNYENGAAYGVMCYVYLCQNAKTNLSGNSVTYSYTPTGSISAENVQAYVYQVTNLTTFLSTTSSEILNATYNINIPVTSDVIGLELLVSGNQTSQQSTDYLQASLLGISDSDVVQFQLPASNGQVLINGETNPLWGQLTIPPALINNGSISVNLQVFASTPVTFSVYDLSFRVLLAPVPPQNFNYLKTYQQTDGETLTLALDNSGVFYQEDVVNAPGGLTAFYQLIEPGTFAVSDTIDDREFIALNNLTGGTDMPRTYDGTNFWRLSQIGPGAPPAIAESNSVAYLTQAYETGTGGAGAGQTAYAGTFAPTIPVGISVTISGFTTQGNNGTFTVVSCTSSLLIVTSAGGANETDPAIATYAGVATQITSITQLSTTNIRRICQGASMGDDSTSGVIITCWGEGRTPGGTQTNPDQETIPDIYPGANINLVINPSPPSGTNSIASIPNGIYQVGQVGTYPIGGSEIAPCFTLTSKTVPGAFNSHDAGYGNYVATYQPTLATVDVNFPIPNLGPGDNFTIAGSTQGGYDGSWACISELNGGQMSITNTALTSNVATYTYTLEAGTAVGWLPSTAYVIGNTIIDPHGYIQEATSGGTSNNATIPTFNQTPGGTTNDGTGGGAFVWTNQGYPSPANPGFLVTVTGCTNGGTGVNNPFNVTLATVTSANYVGSATFTVSVTNPNIASGAEDGAVAVINGTSFTFDPGVIVGNATAGGTIVQQGGLAGGTRQAVTLFLTQDGLLTQASYPIEFNLSANAQAVNCSAIPTGPSNVVARVIAFTEAGQQGVPGAFFYYIPLPVQTVSPLNANQQITYSSTIIPNNTQTTASFSFTDNILLSSTEIDIVGSNNFNQIELGASLGLIKYSNRTFAWGTNSKVNNIINYSFDGGSTGGVAPVVGTTTYTAKLVQQAAASSSVGVYSLTKVQNWSGQAHNTGNGANLGAKLTLTSSSALFAGDTVLVGYTAFNWSGATPTIASSLGNSYGLVRSVVDGEFITYLYACSGTAAGIETLTITLPSSSGGTNSFQVAVATEFSGILTPIASDGINSNTGTSASFNSGTITTANPNDIIFSVVMNDNAAGTTPTVPSGFTGCGSQSVTSNEFSSIPVQASAYFKATAAGVFSPLWAATSWDGLGISAAFRLSPTFAYGQTTLVKELTLSVTSGNAILVAVEAYDYGVATIALTDSQSNTYHQVNKSTNGPSSSYIFYTKATASNALTITVTMGSSNTDSYLQAVYAEINGLPSSISTDGTATNEGTFSGTFNTGTVTTAGPADLILSCLWSTESAAFPAGWTTLGSTSVSSGGIFGAAFSTEAVAGSYAADWTGGTIAGNGNTVAFSLNANTGSTSSGSGNIPLGWTSDPTYGPGGSTAPSPLFGFSYVIANSTGSTISGNQGMITQDAYEDYYKVPIILPQQNYGVRVTCANLGGATSGSLVVDLYNPQTGQQGPGFCTIPLASMTSEMAIFTETLLTTAYSPTVPSGLVIRIYGVNLPAGAKVYVDRIEPFLTTEPLIGNGTAFFASYANNFEAFDSETGVLGMGTNNQQPVRCAFTLFDQLVGVKTDSMYSTTDNGQEPYTWNVREISNVVGTPSCHGVAVGEGWAVIADQDGLFLWDGGQPQKISGEIQPIWDSINWKYGNTLWVTNDAAQRRICIGVPIATPNQYFPDFPTNANPTQPNVVLMLSYRELNSASALVQEGALRQTFIGTLKAYQLGRKWSAWNIQSPYSALCIRNDTTQKQLYGNGLANSKIYQQLESTFSDTGALLENNFADDGLPINWRYQTYGFIKSDEAEAKQLGVNRYFNSSDTYLVIGTGTLQVKTFPDFPTSPRVWVSTPQPLACPPAYGDTELPINRSGFRFYKDFTPGTLAAGNWFQMSRVVVDIKKDPHTPKRGGNY